METKRRKITPEIRLNFQLAQEVNPLLAGDLGQFPKGRARHMRLMTLATIGLTLEKRMLRGPGQQWADVTEPVAAARGHGGAYRAKLTDDDLADIG